MSADRTPEHLKSNTFGLFDPATMGITLYNLAEMERNVEYEQEKLRQLAQSGSPNVQSALWEHQKRFEFYYRVRAHEKAHWYTFISSSITIARLAGDGDTFTFVANHLKEIASKTQMTIKIPLSLWIQRGNCPKDLADSVLTYNLNKIINAAIDGLLLPQHFIDSDTHILSAYFPDLKYKEKFWETDAYRVGARSLIEGAGKAAEWLYFLRKDRSLESKAWKSIKNDPIIYRLALDQLTASIPNKSLLDYLQVLVVLIDFSLNPSIESNSWPFLWGQGKGEDLLPGFRFQRLLDLLRKYPKVDISSKERIALFFESASTDKYGWKTSQEVTNQLIALVKSAKVTSLEEIKSTMQIQLWNPLETILTALAVKTVDPLAYVPPVNAQMINATKTYPPIDLTSGIDRAPKEEILLMYMVRSVQDNLINDIVNVGSLRCPINYNEWMSEIWKLKGWCDLGESKCASSTDTTRSWKSFLSCRYYSSFLANIFGNALNRIEFLQGDR